MSGVVGVGCGINPKRQRTGKETSANGKFQKKNLEGGKVEERNMILSGRGYYVRTHRGHRT